MLIKLARCKFYTVCPLYTAISATFYWWYALVCSKRPVGEKLHSHRGIETNPVNQSRTGSKFGWYGKVNQKSSRFTNVPFYSHMNKKTGPVQVQFRSTFRTCWFSTVTRKCISLTLSQYIRETLFSCRSACSFLFADTSRVLSRIFCFGGKSILKKIFEPRDGEKKFF